MRGIIAGILGSVMLAAMAGEALAASGAIAPPSPPVDPLHAPPVQTKFVRSFSLGGLTTQFPETDLNGMRGAVAAGSVQAMPGSISWLCYDLPKSGQRLWLSSEAASNGFIDTVTVKTVDKAAGACAALPDKFQPLVIGAGLRLGMGKADLLKLMGAPSRQVDTWLVYSDAQGVQGLAIQLVNDKIVFLSASRMNAN